MLFSIATHFISWDKVSHQALCSLTGKTRWPISSEEPPVYTSPMLKIHMTTPSYVWMLGTWTSPLCLQSRYVSDDYVPELGKSLCVLQSLLSLNKVMLSSSVSVLQVLVFKDYMETLGLVIISSSGQSTFSVSYSFI